VGTSVSEGHTASFFKPKDKGVIFQKTRVLTRNKPYNFTNYSSTFRPTPKQFFATFHAL
jgi:hypothetical protein